jgi:DNA-binding NtrC family response regulator
MKDEIAGSNVKKTILVIEDEIPLLKAIGDKLERSGFQIVSARTVKQALGMLEDIGNIDIIWLDHYLLGKEDGLDFVSEIKNHDQWKHIPVFVVSNTASLDKVQSYIRLGASKFYTKANYRLDKIIEDIRECLEKKENN